MMTADERLAYASDINLRAFRSSGKLRTEILLLAQGWRLVARLAHWQDEWTKDYEISN